MDGEDSLRGEPCQKQAGRLPYDEHRVCPGFWPLPVCGILTSRRTAKRTHSPAVDESMGLLGRIEKTEFVRAAVEQGADLSELKQRPTPRTWFGIFFMGFSYLIGWPAIALLGFVSIRMGEPWWVAVGGPALYGLSHLVFLLGMVLAGTQYTRPFLRWAARRAVEKWGTAGPRESARAPVDE